MNSATPITGPNAHWSLLASVQQWAPTGPNRCRRHLRLHRLQPARLSFPPRAGLIGGINEPPSVMDNESVDLVDLNGDGLPDCCEL